MQYFGQDAKTKIWENKYWLEELGENVEKNR